MVYRVDGVAVVDYEEDAAPAPLQHLFLRARRQDHGLDAHLEGPQRRIHFSLHAAAAALGNPPELPVLEASGVHLSD